MPKRKHGIYADAAVAALQLGSRMVRRRFAGSRQKKVNGPTSHGQSAWVRCVDKGPLRYGPSSRTKRWREKVQKAIDPNYKHFTVMQEYGFWCGIGRSNSVSAYKPVSYGLSQIALNTNSNEWSCASIMYDTYTPAGNAGALLQTAFRNQGNENSFVQGNITTSRKDDLTVCGLAPTTYAPNRFERKYRNVYVELRNPHSYGVRVVLYDVVRNSHLNAAAVAPNAPGPTGADWTATSDYGTPLESWSFGMAQRTMRNDMALGQSAVGLHDSERFRLFFKIRDRCVVYLPPGGTTTKVYKISSSLWNVQNVWERQMSKGDRWIVMKYIPEVQILPDGTTTTIAMPGAPTEGDTGGLSLGRFDASIANRPNQGVPAHVCLYGKVTYRSMYSFLPSTNNPDVWNVGTNVPSGAIIINRAGVNINVAEREDVGGGTTGVLG